jgi:hypothetical protein
MSNAADQADTQTFIQELTGLLIPMGDAADRRPDAFGYLLLSKEPLTVDELSSRG